MKKALLSLDSPRITMLFPKFVNVFKTIDDTQQYLDYRIKSGLVKNT